MISRRRFLQSTLAAAAVPLLPRVSVAQTLKVRPSWSSFSGTPLCQAFMDTIALMKANTNAADPNSWAYWTAAHQTFCPHRMAYFCAWHRGFLFRIEAQIRKLSGMSTFMLPYWDYYTNPIIPSEFTDPASPLYMADRTGTDVSSGMSLDPFADTVVNFPRGTTNAFEPILEARPHANVHNLIGGSMAKIAASAADPVFWVHHASIDRLWAAWEGAGGGRTMPASGTSYWSGSFNYGKGVATMGRTWTQTTSKLGYTYEDTTMPTSLPSGTYASTPALMVAAAPATTGSTEVRTLPLGQGAPLELDQRTVVIDVPLTAAQRNGVRSMMLRQVGQTATSGAVSVVLEGVRVTGPGSKGGYFFKVMLGLPGAPGKRAVQIDSLGPFEISSARQMAGTMRGRPLGPNEPVTMTIPATDALQQLGDPSLDRLRVTFVRVDGKHAPKGTVITVERFRVVADGTP